MKFDFLNLFHVEGVWAVVLYVFIFVIVSFPLVIILLENRNPVKTLSWILVLVLIPFLGILLYLYFGKNLRKEKIFTRKEFQDAEEARTMLVEDLKLEEIRLNNNPKLCDKYHLMKLLYNNSKAILTQKNQVKVLNNGEETFSHILQAIAQAEQHIHLEYYIIEDDEIGNKVKNLLIDKRKQGVEVRLIFDDVGCWGLSDNYLNDLKQAGVELYPFMPVSTYRFANKINYRNHRKIIVIDGKFGFVGGLNIADRYLKGNADQGFWRDTHLMLEGDAVLSLQMIFSMDWFFMSGKSLKEVKYFPQPTIEERTFVQIAASGPDSDWASIMQTYFSAIATAKEYVYISTPYFLPNDPIMVALRTAALSGITIRILLPERNDSFLTNWGSRSFFSDLLEAGVEIYLYTKGFTHSKLLMVDDIFATVGTSNMDIRSFDQNFEVNALIYDETITKSLKLAFEEDLLYSSRVILEEFRFRPLHHKFMESFARLFTPVL